MGNKIDYIIPSKAASSTYPTIRYTVCIHNLYGFQTSSASVGVMFLIHAPIAPLAGREESRQRDLGIKTTIHSAHTGSPRDARTAPVSPLYSKNG